METQKVEVAKLHVDPNQPREIYEGIEELAESMRNKGFMPTQAITVAPHPEKSGEFLVIMGARRSLAAGKAHLQEIDAFVIEGLSEKEIYEMQLVENENRKDLKPMNRARAIAKALDRGLSEGRVARIFGVSVATIKAELELVSLAKDLHNFVDDGSLPKEVARNLATSWANEPGIQVHVFNNFVKDKKTAKAMLAGIKAYQDQVAQVNLFAEARKNAGENGGLKKARKASERLEKVVNEYANVHLGDKNVINARKRETGALETTAKLMKKIADQILADVEAYKAGVAVNQPKEEPQEEEEARKAA